MAPAKAPKTAANARPPAGQLHLRAIVTGDTETEPGATAAVGVDGIFIGCTRCVTDVF